MNSRTGRGLLGVAGLGTLLYASNELVDLTQRGDREAAAVVQQDTQEGIEALLDLSDRPNCVEIVQQAGTAKTFEVEVAGHGNVTRVQPEIGANKPLTNQGEAASEGKRLFGDAITNPFMTGPDAEKLETEVKATFCEDPVEAVITAHMLGNIVVDDKRLADSEQGEWLREYADLDQDGLNDKAAELAGFDLDHDARTERLERNQKHQDLAENLAAVLDNMRNAGVITENASINYGLAPNYVISVVGVPEIVINPEFPNSTALEFIADTKAGRCLVKMGFNVFDQRPELFVCELPPETTETTTPSEEEDTTTTGGDQTTTTQRGVTTTTRPGVTTTTVPTTARPVVTVPAPTPIGGGGSGGSGDNDNDPNNNTTTSTTAAPTTSTTIRAGGSTTTTTEVPPTTSTTVIPG